MSLDLSICLFITFDIIEIIITGHELTMSSPKSCISWCAVGCYYFCCKNLELAHKYFLKSTKIDKRFVFGWIALGHCMSAQEEGEHALAVYRTAMRLSPGDYRPLLFIAKELVS